MLLGAPLIRTYRALFGLLALAAVSYELGKLGGGPHWSTTNFLSYFTILSNLFAAGIFLAGSLRYQDSHSPVFELLRGAAVVYILTTGIVYALLLSGQKAAVPWANIVEHQVMPIVVALDWLNDPPLQRIEWRSALLWMSFPLVYVIYTLLRGVLRDPHWYPYFFLDPDKSGGYLRVAADCVGIAVGILALIALVRWAGNRRGATRLAVPGAAEHVSGAPT